MQSELTTAALQLLDTFPAEWQKRRLDEVCAVIDCPHTTPTLTEHGPYVVRSQDIRTGVVRLETTAHVSEETYEERVKRSRPEYGDILYSREGTYFGIAAEVPQGARVCLGQRMVQLRPEKRVLVPRFLKYWLNSPPMGGFIAGLRDGSVAERLNMSTIRGLPVPVPPLAIQAQVAQLLGGLDDRIDLLRQTNATLESIAQALFKSWFIDFDPVRAKAEGREPEGMDAATAALFPAEFEESELGLLPKGWTAGSVYEIASVIYGAPFASKQFNTVGEGLPLVRIRDLRDEAPGVWTQEVHPKGYLIQPGDIVVGMDGEFRAYLWGGESAWLNQRVCCFQPIAPHGAAFVRCSIAAPLAHIEATEVATTVIHLGKGDIDRFKVVVPTPQVAKAFSALTAPLYARVVADKTQGRSLAAARDTLLPRLISGRLRLPEAQAQLEDALA